jgi:hypothetical protein
MKRTTVSSTNLASVGYDPISRVLEIAFHSGGVYRYSNVPESIYQGLLRANSKGTYFNSYIKDRYSCHQIS